MAATRYLICCFAIVLSACSGSAREEAARIPAADVQARRSTATPTLDVPAGLDVQARRRHFRKVVRHDGRRTAEEGERALHHAAKPDWDEVLQAALVGFLQNRERVTLLAGQLPLGRAR